MENARRQRYLKSLAVETWLLRATPDAASVAAAVTHASSEPVIAIHAPARPSAARPVVASAPDLAVPQDWTALRAMVSDCQRCKLCTTRTQTVFGVGVEDAPLMVVGEGPGADEDAQGEPFVGRAGKLLDEMLRAVGHSRKKNVYIANVVKCRPPGNRDPEGHEAAACRPYLEQQIRLVKPKLIVGLGRIAAQRLLQTDAPLSRLRGEMHQYGPDKTPLLITYHPAYLLRSPREKAKSWDDLKKAQRYLAGSA